MLNVDPANFTPLTALGGGLLIGLATAIYLLGAGRIAGIAGHLAALLNLGKLRGETTRLAFIAGLVVAPLLWRLFAALPPVRIDVGPWGLIAAGLLVGVGVRMGNGCTSGHGVCGLSRLSLRSLVAVVTFMAAGMVTVYLLRHVLA